jgi:hypothetical protein
MKKLVLVATIGATLIAVKSASAQVHFGAGPGGLAWKWAPDSTPVGIVTTSGPLCL